MTSNRNVRRWTSLGVLVALCAVTSFANAQFETFERIRERQKKLVKIHASIEPTGHQRINLRLTANITKGRTISSTTQKRGKTGGPLATRIEFGESQSFSQDGETTCSPKPKVVKYPEIWPDIDVEQHADTVTWTIPIAINTQDSSGNVVIRGNVTLYINRPDRCGLAIIPFEAIVIDNSRNNDVGKFVSAGHSDVYRLDAKDTK